MRKKAKAIYDPERRAAMAVEQQGLCAICLQPPSGKNRGHRKLYSDHCHRSGVVRGLLCNKCNLGLGMFRDSPAVVEAALMYLRKHEAFMADGYNAPVRTREPLPTKSGRANAGGWETRKAKYGASGRKRGYMRSGMRIEPGELN